MRRRPKRSGNLSLVTRALSRLPSAPGQLITRTFSVEGVIASSGAGIINAILSMNPTGIADFTALAPLYDEIRFVGGRIKFFCAQQNSLTVASAPIVAVYDNDDATSALSAYATGIEYPQKVQFAGIWDNQSFPTLTFQGLNSAAAGTGQLWVTTGAPNTYPKSVKLYGTSLTASTNYLQYTLEIVFQLRTTN
jgi:hypothetical protein